jgi:hypothetical protein
MNAQLKLITPGNQNRSVQHPTRPPNAELRTREHLLPAEIDSSSLPPASTAATPTVTPP